MMTRLFMPRQSRARAAAWAMHGFTLLELLVALAIFAVLYVMAFGGLQSVMSTQRHVERQTERLAELQTAFTLVARDIEQIINRDIRDGFGDRQPSLTTASGALIEFTRSGWRNPLPDSRRSSLQRVAYMIKEDRLTRLSWAVLDRAQDSAPVEYPLLDQVTAVDIRLLDDANQWHDSWPPPDYESDSKKPTPLPKAIEITVEAPGWGRVPRLFRVPGAGVITPPPAKAP